MNRIAEQFMVPLTGELLPRYNIAPTQNVLAIMLRNGQRQLDYLRWGLVPSWARDIKIAASLLNARSETVAEKPAFRAAFRARRCLIPADGYYEWQRVGKLKQPYLYEVNRGQPFAFAGLWKSWRGPSGNDAPLLSCTILTTEANALTAAVHDRMPVILHPADYAKWLDPQANTNDITELLVPFEPDAMTAQPVTPFVNNARNEGEQCVEPWK